MDLEVAITTCAREPAYVTQMLESYFSADARVGVWGPPRLVVDGLDTTFLGPWENDARVMVDAHESVSPHVHHRICLNTTRAIGGGVQTLPLLLCQDDIVFSRNWVGRFKETVTALERSSEREKACSILTLWVAGQTFGSRFWKYNPKAFHGNLCLYISAECRPKLAAYMEEHSRVYEAPDDVLVKTFACTGHAAIFASNPSLCQHIGMVSTNEPSGRLVRAKSFREVLP